MKNFWDESIDYTISEENINNICNQEIYNNQNKQDISSNKQKFYVFNDINDINNIEHLPGKIIGEGILEYSRTKRWDKSLDKIEDETNTQQQILENLNEIVDLLEKIFLYLSKENIKCKVETNKNYGKENFNISDKLNNSWLKKFLKFK